MWMEEFSGLRDYGENSITVKELTDFESRIIYIYYPWIFWEGIIFEMNKIFWGVDETKCRINVSLEIGLLVEREEW